MLKIPFWKRWASFLVPITLETASSNLNPNLSVVISRGRFQLLAGKAIYSWDDLYHNFTIALQDLDRRKLIGREGDVLLLGLGLAAIPYIFEKVIGRNYAFTAVELDEVVAGLAARYTLPRLKNSMEIITADASVFVQVTEQEYDFVIVDVFEDDYTPASLETDDFLLDCMECLRPGGILLFNRLHGGEENKKKTKVFFEETFKRLFPKAWYIDTQGNWILVAQDYSSSSK